MNMNQNGDNSILLLCLRVGLALLLCVGGVNPVLAERTTTYFHTDALGSVVAASDEDGNLLWRKSYSPYGQQIDTDTDDEKLSYTGKPHDENTGLTYFGARYYDPQVGRFMGIDPAGVRGHVGSNPMMFNRYAYANNNPYRYVDPDGGSPKDGNKGEALGEIILFLTGSDLQREVYQKRLERAVREIEGGGKGKSQAKTDAAKEAKRIEVSASRHPEAAKHIQDAQAAGHPKTLTIDRANAAANRKASLQGVPAKKSLDRDEYPPAMFQEGGAGASVRHINPSHNRGAGSCIGAQCSGLPDGTRVRVEVVD